MNQSTLIGMRFSDSRTEQRVERGRAATSRLRGASVMNVHAFNRPFFARHPGDALSTLEDHTGMRTCGAV